MSEVDVTTRLQRHWPWEPHALITLTALSRKLPPKEKQMSPELSDRFWAVLLCPSLETEEPLLALIAKHILSASDMA